MRRYCALVFLFVSFSLFCEDIPVPESWGVAAVPFYARNEASRAVSVSFPLLVMEKLSGLRMHLVSADELAAYNEYHKKKMRNKLAAELSAKIAERDELLFSPDYFSRWNDMRKKNREISEIRKKIAYIDDIEDIDVSSVSLFVYNNRDGQPVMDVSSDVSKAMADNDVVFLISGDITVDEQYVVADIRLYNLYLDSVTFSARYVKKIAELDSLAVDVVSDFAPYIVGVEPASLSIKTDENTVVYVDGRAEGLGDVFVGFLLPGQHRVLLESQSGKRLVRDVLLKEGETLELDVPIGMEQSRTVDIKSEPSDALVFVDGVFAGRTPCSVDITLSSVVELRKEGYDSVYITSDMIGDSVDVSFKNPDIDWQKRVIASRDRFYTSFGLFFLSLPVTVISYGIWEDSYLAYNDANKYLAANADEYASRMSYAAGVYYGGLFLNATFFVMTVYNLNDYLKSLDRL